MTPSDAGSLASAAAAVAALIVSLISLRKTNQFNARQEEIAQITERLSLLQIEREQAAGLEEKSADVSANLLTIARNDHRLKVFNRGKGVARNVRLIDLMGDESLLIASEIARKFPIPNLEQHQWVDVPAAIHLGSDTRAHIKLLWDDDRGTNHEKELTPIL